ncbi:MAG: leucine-rich repeat protein [Treponema sp.]|nr:leucine-rich repeat protein [Treponema sp.]
MMKHCFVKTVSIIALLMIVLVLAACPAPTETDRPEEGGTEKPTGPVKEPGGPAENPGSDKPGEGEEEPEDGDAEKPAGPVEEPGSDKPGEGEEEPAENPGGNKPGPDTGFVLDETGVPIFSSAAALKTYLAGQPENTATDFYKVKLRGLDLSASEGEALKAVYSALSRYTALDFSECSGSVIYANSVEAAKKKLVLAMILPGTIQEIKSSAFLNFNSLVRLSAPGLTTLHYGAFKQCKALTELIMPKLREITDGTESTNGAFSGCPLLDAPDMPELYKLGAYAFYNCTGLKTLDLPKLEILGNFALKNCTALKELSLPRLREAGNSAFYGCESLESVNLPQLSSLGESGFWKCTALQELKLPRLTSAGDSAFYGCTSLSSLNLPEVESLGISCFKGCKQLVSAILPKIKTIGNGAFNSDPALVSITLGTEPPDLGTEVFAGGTALKAIYVPGDAMESYRNLNAKNWTQSLIKKLEAIPQEGAD